MDLEPTDDQRALVAELRRLLADRLPRPALVDADLWGDLDAMGVLALPVPAADGGVGLGWAEAALAFAELGRSGAGGPFVATAAARAAGLADGVTGLVPAGAGAGPGDRAGNPVLVEHLDRLDSLLVAGDDEVRRVRPPRLGARPVERPLDPLTPVHLVDELPAGDVVADAAAARLLRRNAALLAAAFQVGLGTAALELGTRYATEREQFGRPIGAFQAVKHLLADAAVGLETARAAVDAAAVTADESDDLDAVARAVVAARIVASRAAAASARACIQVHGGMGYTWDLDAHLHLKRVLVLDQTPGTVDEAVDQLAAALR